MVSPASGSNDPLSTDADAEPTPGAVDTVTFLQSATGGALQITVTVLLRCVFPRVSTKLAWTTSVPNEPHVKVNDAFPEASVGLVPGPLRGASGPLVTLKVTATPGRPLPLMSTTFAVTGAGLPTVTVWVGGGSEMPDARIGESGPCGRPSALTAVAAMQSKTSFR